MRDDFGALWALSPSTQRRAPTPTELAGGFPCGPFDLQLFNEMMFALTSLTGECNSVLDAAGIAPNPSSVTQLAAAIQLLVAAQAGGGLKNAQVITASGTYTKTPGTKKALIIATAGGGAGGSTNVGSGGSGGGNGEGGESGATAIAFVDLSSVSSVSCTVGAGGVPSAIPATPYTRSGSGGTTSFGGFISSLPGGMGGMNRAGVGNPAGGTTGGVIASGAVGVILPGNPGNKLALLTTSLGAPSANGGASFWGGAGIGKCGDQPDGSRATYPGGPATGYGSGGGGAACGTAQDTPAQLGGPGGAGVIYILEFA